MRSDESPRDYTGFEHVTDHIFDCMVEASTLDLCEYVYVDEIGSRLCRKPYWMHKYIPGNCPKCRRPLKLKEIRPGWLREEREKRGLSLRAAAKTLGMSAAYLSDIELGRRKPGQKKQETICSYYEQLPIIY